MASLGQELTSDWLASWQPRIADAALHTLHQSVRIELSAVQILMIRNKKVFDTDLDLQTGGQQEWLIYLESPVNIKHAHLS